MRRIVWLTTVCLLTALSVRAEVQVTTSQGRVSIVAKQATAREILAEWARVGQIRVVNIERIPNETLTLEVRDMPERQALDIILRSVGGYVAAPRAIQIQALSEFDRILVMAASPMKPGAVGAVTPTRRVVPSVQAVSDAGSASMPIEVAPAPSGTAPVAERGKSPAADLASAPSGEYVAGGTAALRLDATADTGSPASATSSNTASIRVQNGVASPGMMTQPAQPPRMNPATWRPGMPTFVPPVPAGVPTSQPGQIGQPVGPRAPVTAPQTPNAAPAAAASSPDGR